MFFAIFRWRTRPGTDDAFRAAWRRNTISIRARFGSCGSRLHRDQDGAWIGYACWPSEAHFQRCWDEGIYVDAQAQAAFLACLEDADQPLAPVMRWTVTDDLLLRTGE
jgi:hypothetical protein